ncbi:hypothetical protein SMICM17S_02522 [Streptomyces microflavus]
MELTADVLREATEVIMAAITRQLEEVRGEKAPASCTTPQRVRSSGAGAGQGRHVTHAVKAAVFGTGSWGTAFGVVLADAGCEVTLWARRAEVAEAVNTTRTNPDYLPGVELAGQHAGHHGRRRGARGAEFAFLVVPSQTLRANLADWGPLLESDTVLVSLMKGVELGSAKLMSEVVADVTKVAADRIAVVTGPNLAREIAARMPAAAVVACTDEAVAQRLQAVCHTPYFRPYTNTDVVGCELGGAVKNVIGLAVGIADGMGLGDNAKGSLITRGLAETTRPRGRARRRPADLLRPRGLGTATDGLSSLDEQPVAAISRTSTGRPRSR